MKKAAAGAILPPFFLSGFHRDFYGAGTCPAGRAYTDHKKVQAGGAYVSEYFRRQAGNAAGPGQGFYPGGCAGAGGIQGGTSGGSCEPAGAADFKNNRTIWFF